VSSLPLLLFFFFLLLLLSIFSVFDAHNYIFKKQFFLYFIRWRCQCLRLYSVEWFKYEIWFLKDVEGNRRSTI
jgi:hypothetical protein